MFRRSTNYRAAKKAVAAPVHDTLTLDYQTRVLSAGGTVSEAILNAHDTAIASVRASPTLTAAIITGGLCRWNFVTGSDRIASQVPFLRGAGTALDNQVGSVDLDYSVTGGLVFDGVKYIRTGQPGNTFSMFNSTLLVSAKGTFTTSRNFGGVSGLAGINRLLIALNGTVNIRGWLSDITTTFATVGITANDPGFYAVSSQGSTDLRVLHNAVVGTVATSRIDGLTSNELYIMAMNNNGSLGSPAPVNPNTGNLTGYIHSAGLSTADVQALGAIFATFNAAIGR